MARMKRIDHRPPPREACIPRIERLGNAVPYSQETKFEDERIVALRNELTQAKAELEEIRQRITTREAELKAMQTALASAREESSNLRSKLQGLDVEGQMPERVEIVSVDNIKRNGQTATLNCICEVDNVVGATTLVLPVEQIKQLIKTKKKGQKNAS
jgi:predicted nuclease with TOPRIM domain